MFNQLLVLENCWRDLYKALKSPCILLILTCMNPGVSALGFKLMTQLRCQIYLSVRLTTICTTSNLFITVMSMLMKFSMFNSYSLYSKTCVKRQLSKRPQIGCQDQLLLKAGQKYCRMLQGEHSAILSTFIKLLFVIKIFILPIFEWLFYTGFTVW